MVQYLPAASHLRRQNSHAASAIFQSTQIEITISNRSSVELRLWAMLLKSSKPLDQDTHLHAASPVPHSLLPSQFPHPSSLGGLRNIKVIFIKVTQDASRTVSGSGLYSTQLTPRTPIQLAMSPQG